MMLPVFKKIYKKIKTIYDNNPADLLIAISSTMLILFFAVIMNLIENDVFDNNNSQSIQNIIFNIATQLLYTGLWIGLIKILFQIIDKKEGGISNIFNYFDLLPYVVMGSLLNYIICLISILPSLIIIYLKYGFENLSFLYESLINQDPALNALMNSYINNFDILLIAILILIPIVYVSLKTSFVNFYIIDQSLSPIDSIKKSWEITTNQTHNIFLFVLLLFILNLLIGIISLGMGLFFSFPISVLFICQYYRILDNKKEV